MRKLIASLLLLPSLALAAPIATGRSVISDLSNLPVTAKDVDGSTTPRSVKTRLENLVTHTSGYVNVRDAPYSAKGDGVTDDTAAFQAVGAALLADNGRAHTIVLGQGDTYLLSRGDFLRGVKRWKIEGNGATIKLTGSGASDLSYFVPNAGMFTTSATAAATPNAMDKRGELFATAAPGATTITLLTLADATKYAAQIGAPILIYGGNVYPYTGYPPAPKYFEWNTVASVNTGTGVITLGTPLAYAYRQDWPEDTGSASAIGQARVRLLSGDGFELAESAEIDDLTVAGLAVGTHGVRNFVARNLVADEFWPAMAEGIYLETPRITSMEMDKLADRLIVVGGSFGEPPSPLNSSPPSSAFWGAFAGLGVRSASFTGTAFKGFLELEPYHVSLRDCDLRSTSTSSGSTWMARFDVRNVTSIEMVGNHLYPIASTAYTNGSLVEPPWPPFNFNGQWTVGSVISATEIQVSDITAQVYLRPGQPFKVNYKNLYGRVTYVRAGAGYATATPNTIIGFETHGTDAFAPGDAITIAFAESINITGNHVHYAAGTGVTSLPDVVWSQGSRSVWESSPDLGSVAQGQATMAGYVEEMEIDVQRAYTGAAGTEELVIQSADSAAVKATVNLKIAGKRTVTRAATAGAQTGDTLAVLPMAASPGVWWGQDQGGGPSVPSGTAAQMPIVLLRVVRRPMPF